VIIPGIFSYYVTGAITASGGCWNAAIVAEVVTWGDTKLVAHGLGKSFGRRAVVTDVSIAVRRAEAAERTALAGLFEELAGRFPEFVRVLAEISAQELFRREQDTVRLYKRWMQSGSQREADLLVRRGLIPVAGPTRRQ
jgi:hypothetical protein